MGLQVRQVRPLQRAGVGRLELGGGQRPFGAVGVDDAGLDLTLAPRYYDYQGLFDYPVGGGMLSIRGFGSDDRAVLVASDTNDIETDDRNRFETTQYFHRADIVYLVPTMMKRIWRLPEEVRDRYDLSSLRVVVTGGNGSLVQSDMVASTVLLEAAGARAVFGFPLRVGAVRLGAMNVYCDRPGPLTAQQHADALVMADVAAQMVLSLQARSASRTT